MQSSGWSFYFLLFFFYFLYFLFIYRSFYFLLYFVLILFNKCHFYNQENNGTKKQIKSWTVAFPVGLNTTYNFSFLLLNQMQEAGKEQGAAQTQVCPASEGMTSARRPALSGNSRASNAGHGPQERGGLRAQRRALRWHREGSAPSLTAQGGRHAGRGQGGGMWLYPPDCGHRNFPLQWTLAFQELKPEHVSISLFDCLK